MELLWRASNKNWGDYRVPSNTDWIRHLKVSRNRKTQKIVLTKVKLLKTNPLTVISDSLTMNLQSILSNSCFSLSAMPSPFRFLIRFFSNFFMAYIIPDARLWQAQTYMTKERLKTFTILVQSGLLKRTKSHSHFNPSSLKPGFCLNFEKITSFQKKPPSSALAIKSEQMRFCVPFSWTSQGPRWHNESWLVKWQVAMRAYGLKKMAGFHEELFSKTATTCSCEHNNFAKCRKQLQEL